MSRSGAIEREFGGEERKFRLRIGEWRDVQEKLDCGPAELLARFAPPFSALKSGIAFADVVGSGMLGRWRVDDIRIVIHFGLVGGGMTASDAIKLVKAFVDEKALLEHLPLAYEVVYASVCGVEDEKPAGELPGETAPPLSPEASSGSASTVSTPPAARSGNRRKKSTG